MRHPEPERLQKKLKIDRLAAKKYLEYRIVREKIRLVFNASQVSIPVAGLLRCNGFLTPCLMYLGDGRMQTMMHRSSWSVREK